MVLRYVLTTNVGFDSFGMYPNIWWSAHLTAKYVSTFQICQPSWPCWGNVTDLKRGEMIYSLTAPVTEFLYSPDSWKSWVKYSTNIQRFYRPSVNWVSLQLLNQERIWISGVKEWKNTLVRLAYCEKLEGSSSSGFWSFALFSPSAPFGPFFVFSSNLSNF